MNGRALAKAIAEFHNSDEGRRLSKGEASGQYLRNRLGAAFKAGVSAAECHACEAAKNAAAKKIAGYFEAELT